MTRQEALGLVKDKVKDESLVKHMLATEAIMRGLARRLAQDEEKWGITGLLHDIDYEVTKDKPEEHALTGAQWLSELGFDEEIVHAVKAHNPQTNTPRESSLDKALFATDPLSGLVTAAAYVMPGKTFAEVKVKSIKKKFKDKAFARGANREQIKTIEELGLTLEDFFEIALTAMQEIASFL